MPPATIAASTNSRETSPGATRGALCGARYTVGGGAAGMASQTAAEPIAAATAAKRKGNPDGGMPVIQIWAKDRKSDGQGKGVSGRVDLRGGRVRKKKKKTKT